MNVFLKLFHFSVGNIRYYWFLVLVRAILGVVIHYSSFVHNMLCAWLPLSRRIISVKSKQFTRLMSGNVNYCWDKSMILLKSGTLLCLTDHIFTWRLQNGWPLKVTTIKNIDIIRSKQKDEYFLFIIPIASKRSWSKK